MTIVDEIKTNLQKYVNSEKTQFFPRFFKNGPGEYGEGDKFLGVVVPDQRKVAKLYYQKSSIADILEVLHSPWHEMRLTALFMLVHKFEKTKSEDERREIYDNYLQNTKYVNNWDLVDSSAHKIVGAWLFDKDRSKLYELAKSNDLWEQRIAIIATMYFIKQGDFDDTFKIATILLDHPHDLIHKAVGWMLREAGEQDEQVLVKFLNKHYQQMPRTMLRYAIEKFDAEVRRKYLVGLI